MNASRLEFQERLNQLVQWRRRLLADKARLSVDSVTDATMLLNVFEGKRRRYNAKAQEVFYLGLQVLPKTQYQRFQKVMQHVLGEF